MAYLHIMITLVLLATIIQTQAQNYQVTFSIEEESPKDTFIGNVSSSYQFRADIPKEEIGFVRFGFLQQNFIQTLLSLHETTGILSTAVVIDRESKNICQSQVSCSLNFDVAARSARPQSSYFAIISITLVINDINDNAPRFPRSSVNIEISESTVVGTSFPIDSAVDLDSGLFSVQNYEIGKQDGDFQLEVVKKLDGSFSVKLVLNSPLDREVKDKYKVVIIAMDGGSPNLFGALTVNISVADTNDNAPIFTENNYNITVRENISIDTTILQVTARDRDSELNGQILYRFSQNQLDNRVNDLFKIDMESGALKLKSKLVYESGTFYKIIIEASDRGIPPQVTQAIATVHVLDVGNNPPVMEVNLLNPGNSRIVNLSESASEGTFVAHVNVIDKDTGKNGEVECQISDTRFKLLSMTGKGFKVVVRGDLDRERQELHQILVTCQDHGQPPLSTSSSFMVHLSDENDTPPMFTKPIFTGTIPENHRPFRTFVQVVAFDEDLGKNGEVRYYIDSESTHYRFVIDELTGNLRADQEFDREMVKEVTFRVIARDQGEPSLSQMAIVKLTISDKNDNVPQIVDRTEFNVTENQMSDTFVGKLKAVDNDEGENAKLMFLINSEYEYKVPFVVFPDGNIKTNAELDRESQSVYVFKVVVIDQGSPRLSSSTDITIRVNDVNDNAPYFNFPKFKNDTVVVRTDTKPGSQVAQIDAVDKDEGDNTIVSYVILAGNDEELFFIDNQKGSIYLARPVSVKQNKTVTLKIEIKDGGKPQHIAESDMKIILTNSNVAAYGVNEEEGANNTLIVIIVVILTAVLSIAMIMIICFLRKFDHRNKTRKNLDVVAPDEKYPTCYMDEGSPYVDSGSHSPDPLTAYDPMSGMSLSKKKEVSFDIDESLHPSDSRDLQNTTMTTFTPLDTEKVVSPTSPAETDEMSSRLNQFQLLQYHQAVLESQTRAWLQSHDMTEEGSSFDVTLPDDKCSDTSEEVTASDSGKGGSEDDIPSNHSKDAKSKTLGAQSNRFKTHHYVAPEFRRQGSLQRKACDINFEDLKIHSPKSPVQDELFCRTPNHLDVAGSRPESRSEVFSRPESRASLAQSTQRSNSRAAVFYPPEYPTNRTLDSTGDNNTDWDTASYV